LIASSPIVQWPPRCSRYADDALAVLHNAAGRPVEAQRAATARFALDDLMFDPLWPRGRSGSLPR